jgi:hypothetical protein
VLISSVAHILALAGAATVQLTVPHAPVSLLKVALRFQPAVPLPVGDSVPEGAGVALTAHVRDRLAPLVEAARRAALEAQKRWST